jgi:hypothetical protein
LIGGSARGDPFGAGEPSIGAPPAYTAASAMTVSTYASSGCSCRPRSRWLAALLRSPPPARHRYFAADAAASSMSNGSALPSPSPSTPKVAQLLGMNCIGPTARS